MTKKVILTFFVTFNFFVNAFAQQAAHNKFEFGAGFGYNITTITNPGNYFVPPKYENGFNGEISAEYLFSADLGLKMNLIYDQKGYGGFPDIFGTPLSLTDFKLNYLTLPVVANIHFAKARNWYINAGPYIGFLLSYSDTRYHSDLQNTYNTTDAGAAFGIGIKFPVSKKIKIFVEFDGQHSLVNIFSDRNPPDGNFENSRSGFNVGVNF